MATIPVVVESEAVALEPGTLGLESSGALGLAARVVAIDAEALRQSISQLTVQIAGLFEDIKAVGGYRLKEVQVQLEINAEGGVSLIGLVKAGAKGAITLTFSA